MSTEFVDQLSLDEEEWVKIRTLPWEAVRAILAVATAKPLRADRRRVAEKVAEAVREEICKRLGALESLTTESTADRIRIFYLGHVIDKLLEED